MNAPRPLADGDAVPIAAKDAVPAVPSPDVPHSGDLPPAVPRRPATSAGKLSEKRTAGPATPDIHLAQAKSGQPDAKAADPAKTARKDGADAGRAQTDRYTVRHNANTQWTAKGTIWTPAEVGEAGKAAPKSPAKREIYVGKFLHDKAAAKLGLKDATGVDMASVSATVLKMAKAGKSRKEAEDWLEKTVIAKAPKGLQARLRIILGRAVKRTWQSGDKAAAWYRMTAEYSPKQAHDQLDNAYSKLLRIGDYMRRKFGSSLTADALRHWLNGSGQPWKIDLSWLRTQPTFRAAESKVGSHFRNWFSTKVDSDKDTYKLKPRLFSMKVGEEFKIVNEHWDAKTELKPQNAAGIILTRSNYHSLFDFHGATGTSNIRGKAKSLTFRKVSGNEKNGNVLVTGAVAFRWHEEFNWNKDEAAYYPSMSKRSSARGGAGFVGDLFRFAMRGERPLTVFSQNQMLELQRYSNARNFLMSANWTQNLYAVLSIRNGKVVAVSVRWLRPEGSKEN